MVTMRWSQQVQGNKTGEVWGSFMEEKGILPFCDSCTLNPFRKSTETSENLSVGFTFKAGSKMAADCLPLLPLLILFRLRGMKGSRSLFRYKPIDSPACVQTHIFFPPCHWEETGTWAGSSLLSLTKGLVPKVTIKLSPLSPSLTACPLQSDFH